MRKIIFSFLISVTVFIATFIIFSLGLKLSADPTIYIIQSIKHMFWQKSFVSLAAGLISGVLCLLYYKTTNKHS